MNNFPRPFTSSTSNIRVNKDENILKYLRPPQSTTNREFGKELTNINLPFNQPIQNGKRTVSINKLQNQIKPTKKEKEDLQKMLKNDIQLYNLRPRHSSSLTSKPMDISMNSINSNSSFNNNNENFNTLNMVQTEICNNTKSINTSFLSEMDVEIEPKTLSTKIDSIFSTQNEEKYFKSKINNKNEIANNLNNYNIIHNALLTTPTDLQTASDYIEDIKEHLSNTESQFSPKYGYMKQQKDVNEKMRAILIDWLVDVHLKYKLRSETLFLATNIIDRYLEKVTINRNKLQLVGISSLFIACKYEEIYPPELKDFVYVTDNAYNKQEVLKMEYEILNILEFNVTSPSPLRFLEIFNEASRNKLDDKNFMFSTYLLELSLLDYRMIKYQPSWIAAGVLYVTLKIKKTNPNLNIFEISGYTEEKLKECAKDILFIYENSKRSDLVALKNKYSSLKYLEVAK